MQNEFVIANYTKKLYANKGSTGWAQEPHLHFEVRISDAEGSIKKSKGVTVDPMPWLQPEALEIRRQDRQKALAQLQQAPAVNQENHSGVENAIEVPEAARLADRSMLEKQMDGAEGTGAVQIEVATGKVLTVSSYPAQNS